MASKRIMLKYNGSGGGILGWWIVSVILSILTIGIYTPWAVNKLYSYIVQHIELEIPD